MADPTSSANPMISAPQPKKPAWTSLGVKLLAGATIFLLLVAVIPATIMWRHRPKMQLASRTTLPPPGPTGTDVMPAPAPPPPPLPTASNGAAYVPLPTGAQQQAMANFVPTGKPKANGQPVTGSYALGGGGTGGGTKRDRRLAALASDSSMVAANAEPEETLRGAEEAPQPGARPAETAANLPSAPPNAAPPNATPTPAAVNPASWSTFTGPTRKVLEGTEIECILVNQLTGDYTGPVDVMVASDLMSFNMQTTLIPAGTRILGESHQLTQGNQRRLAITFHRMFMDDGFSVPLEHDPATDKVGTTGVTGPISHHYAALFGTSIALGLLGGFSQLGNNGSVLTPSTEIRNGISSSSTQEATQILNRMLNQLPTITVKHSSFIRIILTETIEVPARVNHTVTPLL